MDKRKGKLKSTIEVKMPSDENIVPILLSNTDLEEAVLGSIILQSSCMEELGGNFSENLFFKEQNKTIARAILELYLANKPIDMLTVTAKVKSDPSTGKENWAYIISALTNKIASTANIEYHVRILQQFFLARHINETCNLAKFKIFNKGNDIFDVYEELQSKLESGLNGLLKYDISSVRDIHMDLIKKAIKNATEGVIPGVPSGISDIDEYTNGWQKSDLIIVAGRPGMGKTAFALSMLRNSTIYHKRPTAMFSLEMSKNQLVGRIQSMESGIDASRIIKQQLTHEEIEIIDNSCKSLYSAPMYIDDTPMLSLVEFKTKARKMVREFNVELIIIDYLQLMRSGLDSHNNREQEIAEISRGIKAVAKELDVPIIALSQLSRKVEERGDRKPMLSDLRESGQIEQDADMVIFAYRPDYYGKDTYEIGTNIVSAHNLFVAMIAKHRNGGLGEILMTFIPQLTAVLKYGSEFIKINTTFVENNAESNQTTTNVLQNNSNFDNEGPLPF